MQLFLTSVLPFLAHDHPSAAAFLTCRHHNFHASIVPEFLSDEERVEHFCEARQLNRIKADKENQYTNLFNLCARTPLMQFSPSLIVCQEDCADVILKPLLTTKYFTRTLQRCSFFLEVEITIVSANNSLETLSIYDAELLDPTTAISISSPPPPATKTLRSLRFADVDASIVAKLVPHFPNLRKLELGGQQLPQELDLLHLSSSLPLVTDLSLAYFTVKSTDSLKKLHHLSSLHFKWCEMPNSLSFLTQENILPELTTLRIDSCFGLSTSSFASLAHAPNLRALTVRLSNFNNDCLQYLENMVHLRTLDLSINNIVGDSRLLKELMQNLFQLEELHLSQCRIGDQGVISVALYSPHSRLRVLNLSQCRLADDDLDGIGKLKNTLEVLDLNNNKELTDESLVHCKNLAKLKKVNLVGCCGICDLSALKDLNLEELSVAQCDGLNDASFNIFSEELKSFPDLRVLDLSDIEGLTEKVFEHLSKNNHLVYQLKTLKIEGMSEIVSSSATARNSICRLKGLQQLRGGSAIVKHTDELMQRLRNLEEIE